MGVIIGGTQQKRGKNIEKNNIIKTTRCISVGRLPALDAGGSQVRALPPRLNKHGCIRAR